MKKISMLALSIIIALGLSACNPTSKSETTPTAVSASETPMTSGIDLTAVDQNMRAQDDYFRHVNGTWLTQTEIPADSLVMGCSMFYMMTPKKT